MDLVRSLVVIVTRLRVRLVAKDLLTAGMRVVLSKGRSWHLALVAAIHLQMLHVRCAGLRASVWTRTLGIARVATHALLVCVLRRKSLTRARLAGHLAVVWSRRGIGDLLLRISARGAIVLTAIAVVPCKVVPVLASGGECRIAGIALLGGLATDLARLGPRGGRLGRADWWRCTVLGTAHAAEVEGTILRLEAAWGSTAAGDGLWDGRRRFGWDGNARIALVSRQGSLCGLRGIACGQNVGVAGVAELAEADAGALSGRGDRPTAGGVARSASSRDCDRRFLSVIAVRGGHGSRHVRISLCAQGSRRGMLVTRGDLLSSIGRGRGRGSVGARWQGDPGSWTCCRLRTSATCLRGTSGGVLDRSRCGG